MISTRVMALWVVMLVLVCSTALGKDAPVVAHIIKKDIDAYAVLSYPDSIPTMFKNQVVPDDQMMALAASSSSPPTTIQIESSFTDYFSENYNRINVPLTWQRVISGGVLLAVGLVLGLYGFRYLKFSLLLTGFIGGGIAAFAILTNTEPSTLWSNRILIYVSVCVAAGLLIGLLMLALNKFATWVLGGAGGLALGVYILSWKDGGLIHNTAGRIGLMAGAAALGMFLSCFLGSLTVVFATVLIGGYMFTLGLDMFLRTGFLENYKHLFKTGSQVPYTLNGGIYGMLGVLSFMFLLGYLVQIPLYFRHKRKVRAAARASAVPPVNAPYPYPYPYPYGASPYGQYGGPPYDSRDHLQQAPHEYTWWGKRKTPKEPMYDNAPYGHHGYHEKGYQHLPNQSMSSSNLLNQHRVQQQNVYHPPPVNQQPVPQPQTQPQPQPQPQPQVKQVQPSSQSINALSTTTTSGEKAVVFEEKKNWLGRTKVVPKLVDPSTVSTTAGTITVPTTGATAGTTAGKPTTTTAVATNDATTTTNPV
ncbi:hypothetical protein BG006_009806 [Podila minutissima]|uniref:Transmembrane protein 198 n=1 Tax=Podila minutissima TaxID=64525 RepID=A0A9P5SHT6_9FUNG|nr:hypothetical protein BG006_009806 [Podila minutissima]